ncbi:MAG: 4Fe-4S binding protein [Deltaproteobacteria bacterium]|jgi:ferredoxin|nr:4Fe-4S binding protein [Deltaproteobacteria bacterium]
MTRQPTLSIKLGPYAFKKCSFRSYNLEIILSLGPLIAYWFIAGPGLWLPLSLGLAFLGFWILARIGPKSQEKTPWRDLDAPAATLAALAVIGPGNLWAAGAAGLGGAAAAAGPGLIKAPGLLGALLGLMFLTSPPSYSPLALLPGAMILILSGRVKIKNAAGLIILYLVWAAEPGLWHLNRNITFWVILFFLGPRRPFDRRSFLSALLAGFLALAGSPLTLALGITVWGLNAFWPIKKGPQPCPTFADDKNTEAFRAGMIQRPDFTAHRLCRRESGRVDTLGELPPPKTCALAVSSLACAAGCLGWGDCARACPYEAIIIDCQSAPRIDPAACRGCGQCLTACPQELLILRPKALKAIIPCRGRKKLKVMADLCQRACLGCGRCAKACPAKALTKREFGPPSLNQPACLMHKDCRLECLAACPRGIPEVLNP